VAAASDLVRVNQEALAACREAAARTGKAQRCIVILNQGTPNAGTALTR